MAFNPAAVNAVEQQAWFKQLQKLVLTWNPQVKKLFLPVWILLIGLLPIGFLWMQIDAYGYAGLGLDIGRKLGQLAAFAYAYTLVPGILRRFRILPITRTLFMLWRREVGVTMFWLVTAHMSLVQLFPVTLATGQLFSSPLYVYFGLLSWCLLFPLWITSNDFSVKRMGQNWHWWHKLTYLAMFSIFLHVVLRSVGWIALGLGVVFSLEILSWVVRWFFPPNVSPQATAPLPAKPPDTQL